MQAFQNELEQLINKHSIENQCDIPDFLLAETICRFIQAIGTPFKKTLDWHGCNSVCHPAQEHASRSDREKPCWSCGSTDNKHSATCIAT